MVLDISVNKSSLASFFVNLEKQTILLLLGWQAGEAEERWRYHLKHCTLRFRKHTEVPVEAERYLTSLLYSKEEQYVQDKD